MLFNDQGRVAGYVARNFPFALFIDETAKSPDINIVALGHVVFHHGKKCFNGCSNIGLIDTCFFCDFVDDIGFCHDCQVRFVFSGRQI